MIEPDTRAITAQSLQAVLGTLRCEKMRRAWRNRCLTQDRWFRAARELLARTPASLVDPHRLAAALYCACGEHTWTDDSFRPESLAPAAWERIAQDTHEYLWNPPEKSLTRGEYEVSRGHWRNQ
jgi:hypothetical protein